MKKDKTPTTMRIWKSTVNAIRIEAAHAGISMTQLLDNMVIEWNKKRLKTTDTNQQYRG
jgi:predicted DNA binding CopG/RHH family protein